MKVFLSSVLLISCVAVASAGCPPIISKDQWGGRAAVEIDYVVKPVQYVIIHHSVTPTCVSEADCSERLANMQSYHMDQLEFNDIGYNFMIGGDGQIYEGAGWHKQGAHTYGWNKKSVGIGFIGNFQTNTPSSKMLEAGKKLIECGVDSGEIDENYKLLGARTVRETDSPGTYLFRAIQKWKGFTKNP